MNHVGTLREGQVRTKISDDKKVSCSNGERTQGVMANTLIPIPIPQRSEVLPDYLVGFLTDRSAFVQ